MLQQGNYLCGLAGSSLPGWLGKIDGPELRRARKGLTPFERHKLEHISELGRIQEITDLPDRKGIILADCYRPSNQ